MKLLVGVLMLVCAARLLANELPGDSVYHADSSWTNQDNETVRVTDLRGKVQVVAFVYTYCEHTCPTIIARLKMIDKQIDGDTRPHVNFTLISLDPQRDTPAVLNAYMQEKKLDERRWTMLHGDPGDVRVLSAMLGVRYRPMGSSDIAHSNMITVLDNDGVIRYQMKGLSEDLARIAAEISTAANQKTSQ